MQQNPKLRFQTFTTDWNINTLNSVVNIYDGTHQTPNYIAQGVPFYSVEHVTANQFELTKFISKEVYQKEIQRVKIEKGDVLMTRIGDIGTAKYINWDALASFYVSLALLKIKDKLLNSGLFLSHYIGVNSFQEELHKRIIHVAFPKKINLGEIGMCVINLPKLEEQTKIADFLTLVDDKIELLAVKKQKLMEYKKGVMQKLFSQQFRFKDENGEDYGDWVENKFGNILEINKGSQLNVLNMIENGKFPVLNGGVKLSGYTNQFNTQENTISISEGGNSCGFVNFNLNKFWSGGHNYTLKNLTNNNYLFLFQLLKFNQSNIMNLRVGSGLPNIQKSNLFKFLLTFPQNIEEQTKIANFLTSIDDKINITDSELSKLMIWKKGLLQQMFV